MDFWYHYCLTETHASTKKKGGGDKDQIIMFVKYIFIYRMGNKKIKSADFGPTKSPKKAAHNKTSTIYIVHPKSLQFFFSFYCGCQKVIVPNKLRVGFLYYGKHEGDGFLDDHTRTIDLVVTGMIGILKDHIMKSREGRTDRNKQKLCDLIYNLHPHNKVLDATLLLLFFMIFTI